MPRKITQLPKAAPRRRKTKINRGKFLEWFGVPAGGTLPATKAKAETFQADYAATLKALRLTDTLGIAVEFERRDRQPGYAVYVRPHAQTPTARPAHTLKATTA